MNWHQDWDYGPNTTGWDDGRCHSLYGTSAAMLPTAATKVLRRLLTAVLLLAGVTGAAFQAIQSAQIVGQVVSRPRGGTNASYQPQRMKHVRLSNQGAKAWRLR